MVGLFSDGILEGIFSFQNGLTSAIKTAKKHYENSLKQLALNVYGLIFGRAYFILFYFIIIIFFFLGGGGAYYQSFTV